MTPDIKSELLDTPALHVHNGSITLMVTYDAAWAEAAAANNDIVCRHPAVIEEIEGWKVAEWERKMYGPNKI